MCIVDSRSLTGGGQAPTHRDVRGYSSGGQRLLPPDRLPPQQMTSSSSRVDPSWIHPAGVAEPRLYGLFKTSRTPMRCRRVRLLTAPPADTRTTRQGGTRPHAPRDTQNAVSFATRRGRRALRRAGRSAHPSAVFSLKLKAISGAWNGNSPAEFTGDGVVGHGRV